MLNMGLLLYLSKNGIKTDSKVENPDTKIIKKYLLKNPTMSNTEVAKNLGFPISKISATRIVLTRKGEL